MMIINYMKHNFTLKTIFTGIVQIILMNSAWSQVPADYNGKPFQDSVYRMGPQIIPGRLKLAYYDLGGEGVAYHDNDSINSGSGNLNRPDGSYLHEFRIKEHVDISYTKSRGIDDHNFNLVKPEMNQFYVGWTSPGEWTQYTIEVKKSGRYRVGIMYTANANGQVSISINQVDVTGPLNITSTYDAADTVKWRQWHHWNYMENIAEVELKAGTQVLTLFTVSHGQMNYDYLEFSIIH